MYSSCHLTFQLTDTLLEIMSATEVTEVSEVKEETIETVEIEQPWGRGESLNFVQEVFLRCTFADIQSTDLWWDELVCDNNRKILYGGS